MSRVWENKGHQGTLSRSKFGGVQLAACRYVTQSQDQAMARLHLAFSTSVLQAKAERLQAQAGAANRLKRIAGTKQAEKQRAAAQVRPSDAFRKHLLASSGTVYFRP